MDKLELNFNYKNENFKNDEIEKAYDTIIEEIYNNNIDLDNLEQLHDHFKNVIYAEIMDSQINNGGIIQFFDNSSGNYFSETCIALKEINAIEILEILDKFQNLFPNKNVPKNWGKRRKLMDRITDEIDDAFFEELDEEYYNKSGLFKKYIVEYINKSVCK